MNFNFSINCLLISNYFSNNYDNVFAQDVIKILTPNVTQTLSDGWQNITTISNAKEWIQERNEESFFFDF